MPGTTDTKDDTSIEDPAYLSQIRDFERRIRILQRRISALENESSRLRAELSRHQKEANSLRTELEKLRQPPLITATIIEMIGEDKAIVKSSTGPNFYVNVSSSVPKDRLLPGMRVALNQRSFAVVQDLPSPKDPMIRAMEIEEAPDVSYVDIGGLDVQLREIKETVELPLLVPGIFKQIGIDPPNGVLLTGPPGTGKTLCARAVAHETKATFIRVIGSELVQKFIGEGARLVREVFLLAKEKAPTIIFIDELDAVGSHRLDIATSGDREVQRTLMQLLSELDGFENRGQVAIIGATNRPDILDPALLRPGRFDRIVVFNIPGIEGQIEIFKIHTRFMKLDRDVKFELIAEADKLTGADIKAICTEAGMFAIRDAIEKAKEQEVKVADILRKREACVKHEHFAEAKKKVRERQGDDSYREMFC